MISIYRTEAPIALATVLVCGFVGYFLGLTGWGLALGVVIYVLRFFGQFVQFQSWIKYGGNEYSQNINSFWGMLAEQVRRHLVSERSIQQGLRDDIDYFRESLDALPDAAIILRSTGEIDWCNSAATRYFDIDLAADQGRPLLNLVRDPAVAKFLRTAEPGATIEFASPLNSEIELEARLARTGPALLLLFVRDISESKKLEAMRKHFVASASHELKTPMTVIGGYLELLEAGDSGAPEAWREPVRAMVQQTALANEIVDGLLELSKLESFVLDDKKIESFMLQDLLDVVVADAKSFDAGANIAINCEPGLQFTGIYLELRSALFNLVQNAIKYSGDGSHIAIETELSARSVEIIVNDDGIGIPPEHIPRLTERFYRVDGSRNSSTGGSGLGLAIVKHVLNRHGGHLEIRSAPGKGSRFSCVLPLFRFEGSSCDWFS